MAGRHQHYLPQFLQKGFKAETNSKRAKTWKYLRYNSPKQANRIQGIGALKDFYSRPSFDGSDTLDDAITRIENRLAISVRQFRDDSVTQSIDPEKAARLAHHLGVRTDAFRQTFWSGITATIASFANMFSQTDMLNSLLSAQTEKVETEIGQQILKAILSNPQELNAFRETELTLTALTLSLIHI